MHESYYWILTWAWLCKKKNIIKQDLEWTKKLSWFKLGLSHGLAQNIKKHWKPGLWPFFGSIFGCQEFYFPSNWVPSKSKPDREIQQGPAYKLSPSSKHVIGSHDVAFDEFLEHTADLKARDPNLQQWGTERPVHGDKTPGDSSGMG